MKRRFLVYAALGLAFAALPAAAQNEGATPGAGSSPGAGTPSGGAQPSSPTTPGSPLLRGTGPTLDQLLQEQLLRNQLGGQLGGQQFIPGGSFNPFGLPLVAVPLGWNPWGGGVYQLSPQSMYLSPGMRGG